MKATLDTDCRRNGAYAEIWPAGAEKSILVQSDWDCPSWARAFGWNGKVGRERCKHTGTDGTVKCPDCGRTATDFIVAAIEYLHAHDGMTAEISDDYSEVIEE